MVLDGEDTPDDTHEWGVTCDPQLAAQRSPMDVALEEGIELEAERDHTDLLGRRHAVPHQVLLDLLAHRDDPVAEVRQHPLHPAEEPVHQGPVVAVEDVPVERVDDHRHPGEPSGHSPQDPRLGRVGVDDLRPLPSHQPVERDQRLEIPRLERRLADDLRDHHGPHPSLEGEVQHRALARVLRAGDQRRVEAGGVETAREVDHVDRRAANVEAGDHPEHLDLRRGLHGGRFSHSHD